MVANVNAQWIDGNLVFVDAAGNTILTFDAVNHKLIFDANKQAAIAAIATADAAAAAGEAPTKAEFDPVVALANANKAKINAVLAALKSAGIIAS